MSGLQRCLVRLLPQSLLAQRNRNALQNPLSPLNSNERPSLPEPLNPLELQ
jgi:hypothetical protein